MSSCDSISAFLRCNFCTGSTATVFLVYHYIMINLCTIQRPYKYFHHHQSSPNNFNKYFKLKIKLKIKFSGSRFKCPLVTP